MKLFRISSLAHPIFSGVGSALSGARWNSKGNTAIYTATSLAGAKLELLAHVGFADLPQNYGFVVVDVPDHIGVHAFRGKEVPTGIVSVMWGDNWLKRGKTLLAKVPSAASPGEFNFLVNPFHPDFRQLKVSKEKPARWDSRHFQSSN